MEVFRKQYFPLVVLCISSLLFFFGWLRVSLMIQGVIESSWIVPIVYFSFGIACLCLIHLLFFVRWIRVSAVLLAFLPSLLFVHSFTHALIICVVSAFCYAGLIRMHSNMLRHTTIAIRGNTQHGIGFVAFSFAFCIASMYYAHAQMESGETLLQKLSLDQTSHTLLNQSLGLMNPEFKKVKDRGVTVDEFLVTLQDMQLPEGTILKTPSDEELLRIAQIPPTDPSAPLVLARIKASLEKNASTLNSKELLLQQGRKQLSDSIGKEVKGQDPITDVLSEIIDQRMRTYLQPSMVEGNASILPFILSLILFLTLWSLGSVLSVVWRYLTATLFHALRFIGVIVVKKITTEQEVIG